MNKRQRIIQKSRRRASSIKKRRKAKLREKKQRRNDQFLNTIPDYNYKYDFSRIEGPVVSIIATANRPQYWQNLYAEIMATNIASIEFVFVGDVRPQFTLPENFRYIYSKVKPSQCVEIAARNATGKYLCGAADDLTFSPKFYDNLACRMEDIKNKRTCIVPSIATNWRIKLGARYVNKKHVSTPIVGMMTFMERKLWYEIGGIDKNFIAIFYDHDLKLRLLESGGSVIPIYDCVGNETNIGGTLRHETGLEDKSYLYSCWYGDGEGINESTFSHKRLKKFEPYVDDNIIEKNQGISGKWLDID